MIKCIESLGCKLIKTDEDYVYIKYKDNIYEIDLIKESIYILPPKDYNKDIKK